MAQSSTSAFSELTPAGFDEYNAQLQAAALQATRHGALLSTPSDLAFHRSLDRTFGKELDACSSRVLSLTNRLLSLVSTSSANANANAGPESKGKGKGRKLESADDVVDHFHTLVVDRMDELLERADTCLDEMLGRSKAPEIVINAIQQPIAAPKPPRKTATSQGRLDPALQHASHLAKPQLLFKRKPDNSNHTIWKSTLRHKYHAQVPLGHRLHDETEVQGDTVNSAKLSHLYYYEITHLTYPPRLFLTSAPIPPRSFSSTPFTWVDTPASFAAMLAKLRGAAELAIDLEHHSYRTFGGFVCLMQLSTREEDFVVDTLAIREEMEELNELFTDPNIIKVLHGAESDIVWLQQDFNLYIVNLFDTYHASKVLEFPRHSLATLLEMYCDFTADKRYQLADWRIRPLPQEMLDYARSDTHFLLFIYDHLRNALLDRAQSSSARNTPSSTPPPPPLTVRPASLDHAHALVSEVLARSAETSLRVYEKERYDAEGGSGPGGWDTLARKWNKGTLTAEAERAGDVVGRVQRAVYRCVHSWRDRVAREEDESVRYVLPNHHLFLLAEHPPADMAVLLSVLHPVPPVMRRRGKELLDSIRAILKEQLNAPETSGSRVTVMEVVVDPSEQAAKDSQIMDTARTATATGGVSKPEVVKIMQPLDSLWSIVAASAPAKSSLFGASLDVTKEQTAMRPSNFVTSRSALFGATVNDAQQITKAVKFKDIVSKINRTLVILPTAVPEAVSAIRTDTRGLEGDMEGGGTGTEGGTEGEGGREVQREEMAFVRAADRAVKEEEMVETVDDSIVIVGRKKKRKRLGAVPTASGDAVEVVTEFDYSGVSNILDEEVPVKNEDANQGRRKKNKNKDRGPSRALPALSASTGTRSRTFK